MTVCETDRIPMEWVSVCKDVDFVCVPSDWCVEVFIRSGLPREKLIKVHHGVVQSEIEYAKDSTILIRDGINLLHVSGADSFPQRKGTSALVYAVKCLQDEGVTNVNLHLRVRQATFEKIRDTLGDPDWLHWVAPITTTLGWWNMMLSMSAVVQPSRAEGFGMVPLEASALGIPTITTPCGGHLEHVYTDSVGNVAVEMGPSTPMRSQGNDVGYAPTVSVDAVHRAICKFIQVQATTKHAARYYAKTRASAWDWSVQLSSLMDLVKAHKQKQSIILGAEEGLRGVQ
jgi:glycosyltransferase involved in cell wall biosynthesis